MGKETKIGLVVIGMLLLVFGTLLIRKLTADDTSLPQPPTARVAEAPSSAGMAEKPAVVLAQKDPASGAGISAFWNKDSRAAEGHPQQPPEVPRRDFLPADGGAAAEAAPDRYAEVDRAAADQKESTAPDQAATSNPFDRKVPAAESAADSGPAVGGQPAADPSTAESGVLEIPTQVPPQATRNPLRRLSAQEPLDEAAATNDEAPLDVPNEPAADERLDENRELADAPRFESTQAPERQEDSTAPAAGRPAGGALGIAPATETEWQPQGPAERPTAGRSDAALAATGKYTIQPNDNLWTISEKVYGTGGYFKALYEHNRSRLPHADRLVVGTSIDVPPTTTLEQNYPTLCPKQRKSALVKPRTMPASMRGRKASGGNVYVVEEGDTLFDIARYELGKASRWAEIYDLNRETLGEDFDHLAPGTELVMPQRGQATDSFTRQGDSRIQR